MATKLIAATVLLTLFAMPMQAQHPLNYGQSEQVYFISAEQRDDWGLNEILFFEQYTPGETGGMWENWTVSVIEITSSRYSNNWNVISDSSFTVFDYDSAVDKMHYINGYGAEFANGRLVRDGGEGYGTFDVTQYYSINDSLSLGVTTCAGHCGNLYSYFSSAKYHYDRKGRQRMATEFLRMEVELQSLEGEDSLTAQIRFDAYDGVEGLLYGLEEPEFGLAGSIMEKLDSIYLAQLDPESPPDTTIYKYDAQGRYAGTSESGFSLSSSFSSTDADANVYYQGFVGRVDLEEFIEAKIGYLPATIFIEISTQSAARLAYHPINQQYVEDGLVILE